jgi:hypothetical protein
MTETTRVPLEPGQTVVLGIGREGAEQWCRTMVMRVDQRLVWVDAAPDGQPPIEARPGESVVCHAWRDMDALYQLQARIAMTRLAPRPLVGLEIQQSQRIQQREYVRVPLSTQAWGFYDGLVVAGASVEPFPLQVSDLSANGLRGRTDRDLAPGDELSIDLPLPATRGDMSTVPLHLRGRIVALPDLPEPLNLRARVVRRIEPPRPGDLRPVELASEIGMTFVDVPREARERIIRFALNVQRDQRRRGMLS